MAKNNGSVACNQPEKVKIHQESAGVDDLFGDLVYVYSRKQALEDGIQVDANTGDLGEVTRQHFKYPVYMTKSVYDLMQRAVNNKRWGNDLKGVWHDILSMSRFPVRRWHTPEGFEQVEFRVIIRGAGRKSIYNLIATVGPTDFDDPSPCVTFQLPGED